MVSGEKSLGLELATVKSDIQSLHENPSFDMSETINTSRESFGTLQSGFVNQP